MNRRALLAVAALLFFHAIDGLSQSGQNQGTWNILNFRYGLTSKLSLFGEAQLRSLRMYDHFFYYEYKGGLLYRAHPDMVVGLAVGQYETYGNNGDFVKPQVGSEFRIWPTVIMFHNYWKLRVEQRYRAEFRFTLNGYRNRYRYRIAFSYPLGKNKRGYQPLQLVAGDEIFMSERAPYFERNRAFVSLNYRVSPNSTFLIGYLHQYDYRLTSQLSRDFLQVGYFLELSRKQRPAGGHEELLKTSED